MKLFMFYIGGDCAHINGKAPNNIELHDVCFSVGNSIEDCYDDIRRQWWGEPKSLHIDSWCHVTHVEGYEVVLSDKPDDGTQKLFFLNMGGYKSGEMEEMHKNLLAVDETPHKAILRILKSLKDEWRIPHKDFVYEVEKIFSVSEALTKSGHHIHLVKSETVKPLEFASRYIRLDALGPAPSGDSGK